MVHRSLADGLRAYREDKTLYIVMDDPVAHHEWSPLTQRGLQGLARQAPTLGFVGCLAQKIDNTLFGDYAGGDCVSDPLDRSQ
jgi:hypothetical protein